MTTNLAGVSSHIYRLQMAGIFQEQVLKETEAESRARRRNPDEQRLGPLRLTRLIIEEAFQAFAGFGH